MVNKLEKEAKERESNPRRKIIRADGLDSERERMKHTYMSHIKGRREFTFSKHTFSVSISNVLINVL